MSAAVVEASRALRDVLAALDVDELSGDECASVVAVLATTEKVCEAARVRVAARAVACGAHRDLGFSEPAEWLSRQAGSSLPAAKAALETVTALDALPATREAVAAGRVSLAQAGEITRAEAEAPGSEAGLLAHCAASLARYKVPRSVAFAEALPRNAVGKIHKPTLRQRFAAMEH